MSLTPEQFDLLLTKEDGNKFITKEYFDQRFDALFEIVEDLATSVKKFDQELVANVGAHDRIQDNVGSLDLRVTKVENVIAEGL